MRTHSLIGLFFVAGMTSAASADLILDGQFRHVVGEAELVGTGGGHDIDETFFGGVGVFNETVGATIGRGAGFANGMASIQSDLSESGVNSTGAAAVGVALGDQFTRAFGGATANTVSEFSVTSTEHYRISASIIWRGAPDLCVVKLHEIDGGDLFVLQANGTDGADFASMNILLEAGTRYSIFGFAEGTAEVDQAFASETLYAGYSFDLTVVPGAPTLAGFAGMALFASRRRRR